MKQYLEQLSKILADGDARDDRTGVGTTGIFGMQTRYDLRNGFPAVTTKRLAWKAVVSELLWFLEGSTDERRLAEIHYGTRDVEKKTIWTANADNQGRALGYENTDTVKELGPVYGKQWRDWQGVDQIQQLIENIRTDPFSRRHIMNSWNVAELDQMALPPCHTLVQFNVSTDRRLNCQLYQRSADMFLGVPFNIASYALLTHIMARLTDLEVGDFVHTLGDAHIYNNHVSQVREQLTRSTRPLPQLEMSVFTSLNDLITLGVDDFRLIGYDPHPAIKADMAV